MSRRQRLKRKAPRRESMKNMNVYTKYSHHSTNILTTRRMIQRGINSKYLSAVETRTDAIQHRHVLYDEMYRAP